jgi:hypothetical protein
MNKRIPIPALVIACFVFYRANHELDFVTVGQSYGIGSGFRSSIRLKWIEGETAQGERRERVYSTINTCETCSLHPYCFQSNEHTGKPTQLSTTYIANNGMTVVNSKPLLTNTDGYNCVRITEICCNSYKRR